MNIVAGNATLDNRFNQTDVQSRADLITAWTKAFGAAPPPHMSRAFLQKALTYASQCKEFGGQPKQTQRALRNIAAGRAAPAVATGKLRPGAHLVREWNGRTYQVAIVDGGYQFDGHTYGSLTAIAKRITGTNWSGPRFFGLNGKGHRS